MISSPLAMSAEEEVCERDLSEIGYLLRPNNWKDFGRSLGLDGVQLQDLEFQYRKLRNAMTSPKLMKRMYVAASGNSHIF